MRTMRNVALLSMLVFLAVGVALAGSDSAKGKDLDGTKWIVKVTPDEVAVKKGEQAFKDTLSFDKGNVEMSECVKDGFAASPYTVEKKGEGWAFETGQKSEKGDRSAWKGKIQGEKITGTMVWTKSDGSVVHYGFEGAKQ